MRTRAGLGRKNSDCEVFTNQTEDLLLLFMGNGVFTPTCICQTSTAEVSVQRKT